MSFPNLDQCLVGIKNKHILIDTCFLIDSLRSVKEKECIFDNLISVLKKNNNILVSVFAVQLEFYKGVEIIADYTDKKNYYDSIIDYTLPTTPEDIKNAIKMTLLYRMQGKSVSSTDFLLAATLKKYKNNIFLLTNDHGDFPMKIFDRYSAIPLAKEFGNVITYGLFQYSEDKVLKIKNNLLKINRKE